jgi:hypothetical protein
MSQYFIKRPINFKLADDGLREYGTERAGFSFQLAWSTPKIEPIAGLDVITDLRLALRRNGYEPIPVTAPDFLPPDNPRHDKDLGKKPLLTGWQRLNADENEIRRWAREEPRWTNTGITTARTPAADFDIGDLEVTETITGFVQGWFRNARILIRYGRHPRFLIPFKCDVPFTRISKKLNAGNKIEILSDGLQFVADGIHPITHKPYMWKGGEPWTVARDELPEITEEIANQFLKKLIETIERRHPFFIAEPNDRYVRSGDDGEVGNDDEPRVRIRDWPSMVVAPGFPRHLSDYTSTSVAETRAACNVLHTHVDQLGHEDRIKIAYALLDELGNNELSFGLFDSILRGSKGYRPRKVAKTWRGLSKSRPREKGVTILTLFHYAYAADGDWSAKVDPSAPLHPMEASKEPSTDDEELPTIAAHFSLSDVLREEVEPPNELAASSESEPEPTADGAKPIDTKTQELIDRVLGPYTRKAPKAASQPTMGPIIVTPYEFPEESTIPRWDWLYGKHLLRGEVSGTAAKSGTGKSSISIVEAIAMTSGRPLLHDQVPKPLRVILINLEDKRETMDRRIAAVMRQYNLTKADIDGRLFVIAKGELKIKIAVQGARGGFVRREHVIESLIDLIREKQADVLSIDSFRKTHGVNENDRRCSGMLGRRSRRIELRDSLMAPHPQDRRSGSLNRGRARRSGVY